MVSVRSRQFPVMVLVILYRRGVHRTCRAYCRLAGFRASILPE
jgi:hypothetical protein